MLHVLVLDGCTCTYELIDFYYQYNLLNTDTFPTLEVTLTSPLDTTHL